MSRGFVTAGRAGVAGAGSLGVVRDRRREGRGRSGLLCGLSGRWHGAAAYEPSVMVTVILFAFATGVRSSRAIERHCREHVAFRVITGNLFLTM